MHVYYSAYILNLEIDQGLPHEKDFKNFDKNLQIGLSKGRGWFLNFYGLWWFYNAKSVFIAVSASLGRLINVSGLILSVLTNKRPSTVYFNNDEWRV